MDQLQLRSMSIAEFETYRARLVPEYAAEHVRAGDWTADQAETLAVARRLYGSSGYQVTAMNMRKELGAP
jgi:hypothetical protein